MCILVLFPLLPTYIHVLYVDLSISSVASLLLAPLRSSHSKRVPPSISFCLSSKLESLSSLFVFRRSPLHPLIAGSRYVASSSFVSSSFGLPSMPRLPSTMPVSFLSFLSFFEDRLLSFLSLFLPLPFVQLEVLILFTTKKIFQNYISLNDL